MITKHFKIKNYVITYYPTLIFFHVENGWLYIDTHDSFNKMSHCPIKIYLEDFDIYDYTSIVNFIKIAKERYDSRDYDKLIPSPEYHLKVKQADSQEIVNSLWHITSITSSDFWFREINGKIYPIRTTQSLSQQFTQLAERLNFKDIDRNGASSHYNFKQGELPKALKRVKYWRKIGLLCDDDHLCFINKYKLDTGEHLDFELKVGDIKSNTSWNRIEKVLNKSL